MPRKKETGVDLVTESKAVEAKSATKQTATDETTKTVKTAKATTTSKIQSPSLTVEAKSTTATKAIASKPKKEPLPKPKTITRIELAQEVARAIGQYMEITYRDADMIVSEIINSMTQALKTGDEIEIRGFGAFRTRKRRARHGRNPKTGEAVEVPSKTVVYFKQGKDLKKFLIQ